MILKPRELEFAVAVFNQCGAVFDPIPGVAVGDAVDLNVLRSMDVAADDSVNSTMTSMPDDLIPKMADVFSNGLQSTLQSCHEGTVSMQRGGCDSAPDGVRSQHPFVKQT